MEQLKPKLSPQTSLGSKAANQYPPITHQGPYQTHLNMGGLEQVTHLTQTDAVPRWSGLGHLARKL